MTKKGLWILSGVLAVVLCAGPLSSEVAAESNAATDGGWLALADPSEPMTGANEPVGMEPAAVGKPVWLPTISIDYTMVSDYVFRGINFSEYPGEGREALNHQLGLSLEWDLQKFGRVGGGFWWEWYADQNSRTSGFNTNQYGDTEDSHIQEIDYYVYYGYTIEPIGLDVEVGFTWYTFPFARHLAMGPSATQVLSGDAATTQEIYMNLGWDDSLLWKALGVNCDGPILNPYYYIAWDIDLGHCGSYHEFGLSHEFAFGEWTQCPVVKDMSLTPSWAMAWSHGWLEYFSLDPSAGNGNMNGIMNMNWGLNLTWALSDTLNIPEEYGSMYLAGFINYSHAIADHWLDDVFYGGMSVGWEW